uniref:Uncharacterized protein n=1 Tax=Cyprinus carpio TaxID=7962 RepID=A0A8C1WZY9_CYPCA
MRVFERSSVIAAEMMMEVFDRTPTEKDLVSQSKELCRDFIHSRIIREGLSWSKVESDLPEPHEALVDVSVVLLKLGDELECMHPYVYRNIAKQLNISVAVEAVVSHAFFSVATEILVMGNMAVCYGRFKGVRLPVTSSAQLDLYLTFVIFIIYRYKSILHIFLKCIH